MFDLYIFFHIVIMQRGRQRVVSELQLGSLCQHVWLPYLWAMQAWYLCQCDWLINLLRMSEGSLPEWHCSEELPALSRGWDLCCASSSSLVFFLLAFCYFLYSSVLFLFVLSLFFFFLYLLSSFLSDLKITHITHCNCCGAPGADFTKI